MRPRFVQACTKLLSGGPFNRQIRRGILREFSILYNKDPQGFGRFNREKRAPKEPEQTQAPKDEKNEKPKDMGEQEKKSTEPSPKEKETPDQGKDKKPEKITLEELKKKIDEQFEANRKAQEQGEKKIDLDDLQKKIQEELERLSKEKGGQSGQKESTTSFSTGDSGSGNDGKNPGGPPPPNPPPNHFFSSIGPIAFFVLIGYLLFHSEVGNESKEITIDQFFQSFLRDSKVGYVTIQRTLNGENVPIFKVKFTAEGTNNRYYFEIKNLENFLSQVMAQSPKVITFNLEYKLNTTVENELSNAFKSDIIQLLIIGLLFYFFRSSTKMMSQISKQSRFDEKNNSFMQRLRNDAAKRGSNTMKITFDQVAGMEDAKKEIMEFVDFLTSKEQFLRLGAKIPRGALLTGPPGTGKTLLAKACATESKVPFITVPGSEFVEIFGGVGASRVRALFEVAKENAPCIIFIDEIDAIGKKRSEGSSVNSNEERENTLNQLLVEMDGFGSQTNVVVFAATNMKDALDPALLRPGRFDRIIDVPLPDIEARKKIFMVHLKKITLNTGRKLEEYANKLATLTPGFSGAQIENVCNEAAIIAARKEATDVVQRDFEMAVERVIAGLEKKGRVDLEQRRLTAIHEAGHGVVSWFLKNGPPLLKLTVIPRSKGAKGFSQYLANENFLSTRQDMIDSICIALSGTLTEEIVLGQRTNSAEDDLKKVQKLAHKLVTTFGMSDNLGPVQRVERSWGFRSYSEGSNQRIDEERLRIVKQCEEITRKLINEKKELIVKLSEELVAKETLSFNEIKDILGPRPFPPKGTFKQYLDEITLESESSQEAPKNPNEPKAATLDG